ncbi:MAG: CopG family transcriptional regulator [Cyanobacteria bacterium K_DeepCast_35m_m1_288]|nr:CopG family transcriptional regulator [Cyanobacteria bacterium K_DeepCast_35m_m1_288]
MRTTLTLDDDVLAAARVLARQRKQPIGSVISALAREALGSAQNANSHRIASERNGLPLLPVQPQGAAVDLELVNSLRDD